MRDLMLRPARFVFLCLVVILAAAPAVAEIATAPIFQWQVKSETATITLVGSIHVGKPGFFPMADPFEKAFAASDALAVEVDMGSQENIQKAMALMMKDGVLPGDETLQDRLEPELYARLEAFAAEKGEPLAMYNKFKPGILAMILVMNEYTRQGFDAELGIDKHFLDLAREREKPIRELETLEAQMDLFLAIDDELDDKLVAEFLDQMDDLMEQTARMIDLWQAGDADGLDRLLQEQIGEDPAMTEFYRKLLDDRNVKMAETIDQWLGQDEDIFVVVGAGHFAGEMGILNLLEEKGWEVSQARAR